MQINKFKNKLSWFFIGLYIFLVFASPGYAGYGIKAESDIVKLVNCCCEVNIESSQYQHGYTSTSQAADYSKTCCDCMEKDRTNPFFYNVSLLKHSFDLENLFITTSQPFEINNYINKYTFHGAYAVYYPDKTCLNIIKTVRFLN